MKTLNIPLEDKEYDRLQDAKGDLNWHDFIMTLAFPEMPEDRR